MKYERTYNEKAQQEFIIVPYNIADQVQKKSNHSRDREKFAGNMFWYI